MITNGMAAPCDSWKADYAANCACPKGWWNEAGDVVQTAENHEEALVVIG